VLTGLWLRAGLLTNFPLGRLPDSCQWQLSWSIEAYSCGYSFRFTL